jgi:peptidyl-dipeptidase Dcp
MAQSPAPAMDLLASATPAVAKAKIEAKAIQDLIDSLEALN